MTEPREIIEAKIRSNNRRIRKLGNEDNPTRLCQRLKLKNHDDRILLKEYKEDA